MSGFQGLHTLEFANSEDTPLLRAADYLVATCVEFTRNAVEGEIVVPEIQHNAHHGLRRMLQLATGVPVKDQKIAQQIGEIMAADEWITKAARGFTSAISS